MGIVVASRKQHRYKMKLLIVAFLIPFVYGDCPPPPKDPVVCTGSDMLCGGEADANGCPTPNWCLHVDPYAPCSIHANCPMTCPEDQRICPTKGGSDGCPGPESCVAKDEPCPFHCAWNEMECPGMHPGEGTCLPMPQNCMPQCPMQCGEDQMLCPQAPDGQGCPAPDDCQPSKAAKAECPAHCPTRCGQNDLTCSQGTDGQGCPMPDICVHNDPTAICQHSSPVGPTCPEGEFACPGAKDDRGCQMAEVCSAKGECPKA